MAQRPEGSPVKIIVTKTESLGVNAIHARKFVRLKFNLSAVSYDNRMKIKGGRQTNCE